MGRETKRNGRMGEIDRHEERNGKRRMGEGEWRKRNRRMRRERVKGGDKLKQYMGK